MAGVLGFTGAAVAAAGIAKLLFVIFLVLFLISLVAHLGRGAAGRSINTYKHARVSEILRVPFLELALNSIFSTEQASWDADDSGRSVHRVHFKPEPHVQRLFYFYGFPSRAYCFYD
jgi:uncharacterized membrane protein YtjA (UPF0391 family)